ncbi:Putative ATP-dependent RNA helicase TDRD12 [Eumeta japonica]|uniref:RNA helicase n=1 Tax=Eumeta variegata TaxID=151549 RepID=A0A4C1TN55_EUMVA|nr:Putative ATP-dependent RNA helicase TDRD12 [Eumeta japonica]
MDTYILDPRTYRAQTFGHTEAGPLGILRLDPEAHRVGVLGHTEPGSLGTQNQGLGHREPRNSIFERKPHIYGDITIKWPDGRIKSLTRILKKSNFALYDENRFKTDLLSGSLQTELSSLEKEKVLKIIEKSWHVQDEQRANDAPKNMSLSDTEHYRTNHNQYKLTVKNLELHNMQMEELDVPKKVIYNCNDFNEVSMSTSLSKSNHITKMNSGDKQQMGFVEKYSGFEEKERHEISPTHKRLLDAKNKLFTMIEECAVSLTENKPKLSMSENEFSCKQTEFAEELPVKTPRHFPRSSAPYSKYRKKKIVPDYDTKTKKCVVCGPPDCLPKLNIQVVPKYTENLTTSSIPVLTIERDLKSQNKEPQDNKFEHYNQINYEDSEDNRPLDRVKLHYIFEQAMSKTNYEEEFMHQTPTGAQMDTNELTKKINVAQSPTKQFINSTVESDNLDISLNSSASQLIARKLKFLGIETSQKSNVLLDNDTSSKNISFSSRKHNSLQNNEINSIDSEHETSLPSTAEEIEQNEEYLSLRQTLQKLMVKSKKLSVNDIVIANCSTENNVNPLKNIDPSLSKFVDKLISPNLMVHTKNNNRIIPNLEMRNVNFVPNIHAVLRNFSVKHPMMLQTVSWFTILRGFSLFMISPSHSGKTLGYLPAICNLVLHHYQETDRFGPICIIVCATARAVSDAADLCKKFLGKSKIVLSYYSGVCEEHFLTELLNGCDILVCTLPALIRLMNVVHSSLNLQRFSILVMDDCEILSQIHEKEIKSLIFKVKKLLQMRVNNVERIQIIVASKIWCDFMEPFAKWAPDTVVCIGSHLECVLYSKVLTSIEFLQKNQKVDTVGEFMKNVDMTKKTVIVCQTNEEVALLESRLKQDKLIVFVANNDMTVETIYNLSEEWREYSDPVLSPVLVCCDKNLVHLNITDAHNLLHYSLPRLYSTFAKRFSVLADSYPSIFASNKSNSNMIKILLDEENIEQLPKILHFVKRCSKEIPPYLDQKASNVMIEKDTMKAQRLVPLCEYLLSLGQCPDFWNCKARHTVFKEYDEPPQWVPKHGFITFQVISINGAVMYSARLLSHIINGTVNKYPQNYSIIAMKMAMYYSNEHNRRPHGIPKIGDICTVAAKLNLYQRCQIVEILTVNDKENPELLLIKLIDDEKWQKAKAVHLYYLPEELKNMPSYVVQVRLGNVQPKDKDVTYSYIADDLVKKMLKSDENFYMKAEIILAIGNILIVDKLEVCQDLVFANQSVVRYDVKKELLKAHALTNDEHVAKLQKIVEMAGLSAQSKDVIAQDVKTISVIKKTLKPCWAHLNKDDFSLVYFASANNLDQIFVRLVKFQNCLDSLTKDIQKYIANEKYEKMTTYKIGELVLAKFPDDCLYYRARIEETINKIKYRCFFVDHGDWREISVSCILPITEEFVSRMPFQAIECRLVGIQPMGQEWTEFSINWFCDQCFMDKSDKLKKMYVKYFTKEVPELTDGHKYGVIMIDTTGPEDIIINQSILDANLAQQKDNEIHYIHTLNFQRPVQESSNSDDSDWEKDAILFKDIHYQRKFDDSENLTKSPLDEVFQKPPIRSVSLIGSDDESSIVDDFYVDMTQEDIKTLFNQTSKITCKQQSIPVTDGPKRNTTPENFLKIETQTENKLSTLSSGSHKINHYNPKEMTNATKFDFVYEQLPTSVSEFVHKDGTPERMVRVEGNPKNSPSILSSFEVVSSVIKSELDSDDFSTAESISLNTENNAKDAKLKPKLYWNQTKSMISIKIEITGVENYEIDIKERNIKFSTTVNEIQYSFDIELYGTIKPNLSQHDAKGLYVLVKLYKRMSKTWLTLTRDNQLKRWIAYDPESIDTSDDEDEGNPTGNKEQFKKYVENTHYAESDRDSDEDFFDDTPERYRRDSD